MKDSIGIANSEHKQALPSSDSAFICQAAWLYTKNWEAKAQKSPDPKTNDITAISSWKYQQVIF